MKLTGEQEKVNKKMRRRKGKEKRGREIGKE